MDKFGQIFDVTLLSTIALIFFVALVGAFLRARHRDPCLKSFNGFHVTLERGNGKMIWGVMELEATGMELRYRNSVPNGHHLESSYILYSDEYQDIQAIYRYTDSLTQQNRRQRALDVKRSFHPGPFRLLGRKCRHFLSGASNSMGEIVGILAGRLRKPVGQYITAAGEAHLKQLGTSVIGRVGTSYDPLLERYVGNKVVIEVLEGTNEVHEHVGILKNYSPDFMEILDVQYPKKQALTVTRDNTARLDCLKATLKDQVLKIENCTSRPVLLDSLTSNDQEQLLNIVVEGGEAITLHLKIELETGQLNMRVVRDLDMIIPRTRCVLRHRAENPTSQALSEIVFDIGVILSGKSRVDAREARLREELEQNPNCALAASNLGGILLQKQLFEEAEFWLKKAYALRYSLPDNGRRTSMMLHELGHRQDKASVRNTLHELDAVTEGPGVPSEGRETRARTSPIDVETSVTSQLRLLV